MKNCSIEGCTLPYYSKDLCKKHYHEKYNRENSQKYYIEDKDKYKSNAKKWRKNNPEKAKKSIREHFKNQKLIIMNHYCKGIPRCMCPGCDVTQFEFLSIDHINGNGKAHRKSIGSGKHFYHWIIENNFPDDLQILCYNCNLAKGFYGQCPHLIKS